MCSIKISKARNIIPSFKKIISEKHIKRQNRSLNVFTLGFNIVNDNAALLY